MRLHLTGIDIWPARALTISVAVVVLAVALQAGPARAGSDGEPFGRTTAVYVVLGLATPIGAGGLEAVHRFGSALEISAGVGTGATASQAHNGSPLQWAIMPRLRLSENARHAVTLGAGISGGNLGDVPIFCDERCDPPGRTYPVHYMLWANFEIGGEHWWQGGFALRYFLGYETGCAAADCSNRMQFPYVGVGLGYAF